MRLARVDLLIGAALVVGVFAAFSPALLADFVQWDDPTFVVENTYIRGFTGKNLSWMWTAMHGGHYHPLTWMSWALDHAMFGLKPFGYHLTNVVLHAMNAVLLYVLFSRLMRIGLARSVSVSELDAPALKVCAGIGAVVFAIHPLRVESVAWITERRDVLSTLFLLLAALAYVRSVTPEKTALRSARAYAMVIVWLTMSCLSKAWGMSFFALMFVLDAYPLRRLPIEPWLWLTPNWLPIFGRLLLQKAPLIIIGVITAVLAAKAQQTGLATKSLADWGVVERVVQSVYGLWFYVYTTFVPTSLAALYQLPVRVDPLEPRYLAAYAFVIAAAIVMFTMRRRWPALVAAGGVYVISLAPVLGILQSGEQFVADRYSYIACMGVAALAGLSAWRAWVWSRSGDELQRAARARVFRLGGVGAGLVALALGFLTFAQATTWENTERLWASSVNTQPSSQVYTNYAVELFRQNRKDEGLAAVALAVKLNPKDGRAWFMFANTMVEEKRYADAERAFIEATKTLPQAYMAYANLGDLYLTKLNRIDQGIEARRAAVRDIERGGRRALSAGPYVALGSALWRVGKFDEARQLLTKALGCPEIQASAQAELDLMHAELAKRERGSNTP